MSKYVELEVKPEGASGQVLAIPLSSTGGDGKAKTYEVRDEKGAALLKVDASTSTTTLGALAGALQLPTYADDEARDLAIAPAALGMLIYNIDSDKLQLYGSTGWINVGSGL